MIHDFETDLPMSVFADFPQDWNIGHQGVRLRITRNSEQNPQYLKREQP